MDPSVLILIGILVFTVASFVLEWLPIDVTALASLGLLLVFDLVTPQEAIDGFSNPAVITVMMMFILSDGLVQSGLVRQLGYKLSHWAGHAPNRISAALLFVGGGLSAFLNNTAVVSIFLPMALDLSKRYRMNASALLLPLSFAAIMGGTCTLIGTSTNLLVSALAEDYGLAPFTVFEFFGLGGILFVLGMAYNLFVARHLLPERASQADLTGKYHMGSYLTEVKIPETSRLVGRTVVDEQISDRFQMNVLEILRGNQRIATDLRHTQLAPGDVLIVRGAMDEILAFKETYRLLLLSDTKLADADLSDDNNVLAEVQLAPNSRLAGATLKQIDFRKSYGCFVLALRRTGAVIRDKVAFVPLKPLDTLLVFGPRQRVQGLASIEDFIPLEELPMRLAVSRRWWISAATIPLVVLLAAFGVMSILKSAILGVVVLLVTGAVRIQRAYAAIDWTVIFMLAALLPLGTAMTKTGLAAIIGHGIVQAGGLVSPLVVLALVTLVTTLVTGFISNNSAAVLMVPIAAAVGAELGVSAKPLLMGVAFAASMSFFTPMGYQTNTMVYGPGGYRFTDYLKVGGPLNLLFWVVATLLIPWFWPF